MWSRRSIYDLLITYFSTTLLSASSGNLPNFDCHFLYLQEELTSCRSYIRCIFNFCKVSWKNYDLKLNDFRKSYIMLNFSLHNFCIWNMIIFQLVKVVVFKQQVCMLILLHNVQRQKRAIAGIFCSSANLRGLRGANVPHDLIYHICPERRRLGKRWI